MKKTLFFISTLFLSTNILALDQQEGATGKIKRMIVNHNANHGEIFITTDDPSAACSSMQLISNDPNVDINSYKALFSYILSAKVAEKTVQFYTDLECNVFRAEMID